MYKFTPLIHSRQLLVRRTGGHIERLATGGGLVDEGRTDGMLTGDDDLLTLKRFGRCRIVTPRQFGSRMHRNTLNCGLVYFNLTFFSSLK